MAYNRYADDARRGRDRRRNENSGSRERGDRERNRGDWRSDQGRMFRWNDDRDRDRDRSRSRDRDQRDERRFHNLDSQREFPINETGSLIASNKVEGTPVYSRQSGDRLGTIYNFMVDKRSGQVAYAVLGFGGFLGMGQHYYPVPWDMLTYDTREDGYVVDIDEHELDRAPSFRRGEEPPFDEEYARYIYGYWGMLY